MNSNKINKPVVIIGGGISGMIAAYELGLRGTHVILIEGSHKLGGLAGSLEFDGHNLEYFYHFLCKPDNDYFDYLDKLGIVDQLKWQDGVTKFFYEGTMYPFSTPLDLIRFGAMPIWSRIRFGANIIRNRLYKNGQSLDQVPARQWLIESIGHRAYSIIWEPLLKIKFGKYADHISAAWIWHRIWRVAKSREYIWSKEQLGYLKDGTQTLVDTLYNKLVNLDNITIHTQTKVGQIGVIDNQVTNVGLTDGTQIPVSTVISTLSLAQLQTLIMDTDYAKELNQFTYIGVVCGLLKLKFPLTDAFWINVNDQRVPYNGIIEYSNLNRDLLHKNKAAYVYIPFYTDTSHPRFRYSDKELLSEYIHMLKLVNPKFDRSWILAVHIERARYAQAICPTGFEAIQPTHETSIKGLFITDSTLLYPEDRTISGSIRMGKRVASLVFNDYLNKSNT